MLSVSAAFALLVVLGALVLTVLGLSAWLTKPRAADAGTSDDVTSDALRELEPRIGRQRPSVKLFDAAVLIAVWVTTTGLLLALGGAGRDAATASTVVLLVTLLATWWSWRRGVLAPLVARAADVETQRGIHDDGDEGEERE